ncbi:MAG: succinyl-CoA synthetase subunit beta [Anaerolineales bacterium]|nr:succinyl-CoA synthetase subunit beta [Anaerolineales bacterium]
MARLYEYQGKRLLKSVGIPIPEGSPARSSEEARTIVEDISAPVVVKAQAWITGRAGYGAIKFTDSPAGAAQAASELLGMQIKSFIVDTVLVEEELDIEREFFASLIIDDQTKSPVLIFSSRGGTGIEEIAQEDPDSVSKLVIDIREGLVDFQARDLVRSTGIQGKLQLRIGTILTRLFHCALQYDARSVEINPLVLTKDDKLVAADCRITVDDYAVYRQPDLNIEVAREYDRPPTELEKIAWQIEKNDYRGTFYFIQMEQGYGRGDGVIGFHGAGGGGSMMSMDAVLARSYRLADYVDTSGNPPASKVYRAAKIILAQDGIDGYFASGSGVASQEQFHSARGLVKAFMEVPLTVPAVIRLGGNAEERAIAILDRAADFIPAPVEGYGKDDTPDFCAERLDFLIKEGQEGKESITTRSQLPATDAYTFKTVTDGTVILDHNACRACESKICIETCVPKILSLEDDVPVINIPLEKAEKGGCIECLACDIECFFEGNRGGFVILPIPGLE